MSTHFDGWPHVIDTTQFTRKWIEGEFLPLTREMQEIFKSDASCDILKGKTMMTIFFQASMRTRMSHQVAMHRLGGTVIFASGNASEEMSFKKGELLEDAFPVINCYRPSVVVVRYDKRLDPDVVYKYSRVPVINAGDRFPGVHPTQALGDITTILNRRGSIDGLEIVFVGDLKNARPVISLCWLLGKFKGITIHFISTADMKIGDDVKKYLYLNGAKFTEQNDLRAVASHVDVMYQTRTQNECGASLDRENRSLGYFTVDKEIADSMKPDSSIFHALPRGINDITRAVDDYPQAVYLDGQVEGCLFGRMALLKMILAPKK